MPHLTEAKFTETRARVKAFAVEQKKSKRQKVVQAKCVPDQNVERLTCSICLDLFKDPVFLPSVCQCVHCRSCLLEQLEVRAKCPLCNREVESKVVQSHLWAKNDLDQLRVACPNNCAWIGKYEGLEPHLAACEVSKLNRDLEDVEEKLYVNAADHLHAAERVARLAEENVNLAKRKMTMQQELDSLQLRQAELVKDLHVLQKKEVELAKETTRAEKREVELEQDGLRLEERQLALQQEKEAKTVRPGAVSEASLRLEQFQLQQAQESLEKAKQAVREEEERLKRKQADFDKAVQLREHELFQERVDLEEEKDLLRLDQEQEAKRQRCDVAMEAKQSLLNQFAKAEDADGRSSRQDLASCSSATHH